MNRLWQICCADSRAGFDDIKASTPILYPALFVLASLTLQCIAISVLIFDWDAINASNGSSSESWMQMNSGFVWTVLFVLYTVGFVCIWWLLTSVYYFGVAMLFNISIPWRNWFGFSCWSSIPLIMVPLVLVIALAIQLIVSVTTKADPWYIELMTACLLIVPFIWCARIVALGLRSWTEPHGRGNAYWRVVAIVPFGLLLTAFLIFCIQFMRLI